MSSSNRKTGPIPVSYSSSETCPVSCPFRGAGCYAQAGFYTAQHWKRVDSGERGKPFTGFLRKVKSLPENQLWRHNIAGDLPGVGDSIDGKALRQLVRANGARRGFTYTHKPVRLEDSKELSAEQIRENIKAIQHANANGFTVNVSANSLHHGAKLFQLGIAPVVAVVPETFTGNGKTWQGIRYVQCPATREGSRMTCARCGVCQQANRQFIITFPAHGTSKRAVGEIAGREETP